LTKTLFKSFKLVFTVVHLNKNDKMVHMKKILAILLVVLVSALSISGVIFNATEVSVNANPETTVGGILGENTTWTLENSPYIITDTVQIPENIVLTIEPGVVIESALNSSEDYMFVLHGKIVARGTVDNKIVFDGGCTATGFSQDPESYGSSFFTTGGAPSDPQVILDHCVIQNGNRFYWGTRGHLNLTNSELTNLGLTFWGYNGDSQIYSSGQDVYIQNNLFINTTGFGIAHLDANVFMRYNLFTENRGPLVRSTQGLESRTFINYNSFIEVSETVLRLSSSGTDVILDATNNYWGTIDTSMIDSWIFDGNDDINIRGVIEYSPILTEPHPDTPTSYVYTELSGILSSDTTWTKENSPYIITETVQIPEGVVLTIEAGVTVVFEGTGDMFLVGGGICTQGTDSEKITFEGEGATSFFNVILSDNSSLQLEYCVLRNAGKLWSITNGVTQVTLRHSMLVDIASCSALYHWREACYIEYNTFVDSGGITLYNWFGKDSEATVYIQYNLVKGNNGFFVRCSPNVYDQEVVVKYNSFVDTDEEVLALNSGLGDYVAMNATENYWGTTDTTVIDSLIYDKNDDISIPNYIEYLPILNEPHPDTPTLPITVIVEYSPVILYANVSIDFDASASFGEYSSIANYTWSFNDSTAITLDTPTTTHAFSASGEYNVTLTVTDEFGFQNSTSTTVTVLEDDAAPVTTDNYDEAWHTSDFTITLTAVDDESGVAETYYRINNGTTKTVGADGQPLITTEGADNTLEYWSVDNAGNEEPSNLLTGIKLDKTPPTVEKLSHLPERDELLEQTVTVSVKVTDLYSGVKNVTLSYNLNDETAWNDIVMTLNSTTGLYECIIPEQEENARVKYTITTYDNAENHDTEDNHGRYFVYTAVPEFPSWIILPLLLAATLFITFCRRKLTKTPRQQHI
jgi:hypothetical protein